MTDPEDVPHRSATEAVRATTWGAALTFSGTWLALLGAEIFASSASAVSWLSFAAAAVVWGIALSGRPWARRVAPWGFIAVSMAAVMTTGTVALDSELSPALLWLSLASGTVALMWPRRRATLGILGLTIAGTAAVAFATVADGSFDALWPYVVMVAAFTLVDGMALAAGADALRAAAQASDTSAERLWQARAARAAETARRARIRQAHRVLHDTLVNTLGVIRRGIHAEDLPPLRHRCDLDARAVRDLWVAFPRWPDGCVLTEVIDALTERAATLQLQLEVETTDDSGDRLPGQVARAVVTILGEALQNVAKHAEVRHVSLVVTWTGARLDVALTDAGRGWSGQVALGHGTDLSMSKPAQAAGVEVELMSRPGMGTRVDLRWTQTPATVHVHENAGEADRAYARTAAEVATWVSGLMAILTVAFWDPDASWGSLLALFIVAPLVLVTWLTARGRLTVPTSAWLAGLVLLSVPAVVLLPVATARTCTAVQTGWWGPEAGVLALAVLSSITRRPAWMAAGLISLVLSALSYPLTETMPAGCEYVQIRLLVVAGILAGLVLVLRHRLLGLWQQVAANRGAIGEQRLAARAEAAASEAGDARLDDLVVQALPLLDGIVDQSLDPRDQAVRRSCAHMEEAMRNLMLLGADPVGVAGVLADVVLACIHRGVRVVIATVPDRPLACPQTVERVLTGAAATVPEGGELTIAMIALPDEACVTMTSAHPLVPAPCADELPDSPKVITVKAGDQYLAELLWPL